MMVEPESYSYTFRGKTDGELENIPQSTCRECGGDIEQPLPTGIWLHVRGQKDFTDKQDHNAIPSSLLEQLLAHGHRHMYADVECALHRKYWSIASNLSEQDIEKVAGKENLAYGDSWFTSIETRFNSMAFLNFVRKSKEKYLKKNPPLPKVLLVYYMEKGRGYYNRTKELIKEVEIQRTDVWNWGWENKLVKYNGKLYIVEGQQMMRKESATKTVYNIVLRTIRKKDSKYVDPTKVVSEIST